MKFKCLTNLRLVSDIFHRDRQHTLSDPKIPFATTKSKIYD